jgi:NAD-dependent deacetylase
VITGAGISTESGIRPYRGKGGLYDDPEAGDRTVEALSWPTLLRDPDRTWRVVAELVRQAAGARPNPAHSALVSIERRVERFVLLTQNVDGLHQAAGSKNVIDIHGNVFDTLCMKCGSRGRLDTTMLRGLEGAPSCAACAGTLRPDVVLFGEMLPPEKVERMRHELLLQTPDVVLVVGTSALFPYIAEPALVAREAGKLTVEINPEPTVLSDAVEFSLRGKASAYLPAIAPLIGA